MSDDPQSRARLDKALAGQQVSELRFTPRTRAGDADDMAGDVILEVPRDDDLGTMLSALHQISPQVFVSRADDDRPDGAGPDGNASFRMKNGMASSAAGALTD